MSDVGRSGTDIGERAGRWSRWIRELVRPSGWSLLLGHVALVCLVLLVLTGIYLTLFYRPSNELVTYHGNLALYQGRELPAAFASVLHIDGDVLVGLIVRRVHHAASYLLLTAVLAHLVRVLIKGTFRKPRRLNYVLGWVLFGSATGLAWSGHILPYDVVAGASLRVGYSIVSSLPYVGEELSSLVFGSLPPGSALGLFWLLHVLLLPAVLIGGTWLHLALVVRQGHSTSAKPGHEPGKGSIAPGVLTKHWILLAVLITALLVLSTALVPWGDVTHIGPFQPSVSANDMHPGWYLFAPEGGMRLLPSIGVDPLGARITNVLIGGVILPAVAVAVLIIYPLVIGRRSVDQEEQIRLPRQSAVLAAAGAFLAMLAIGATNDYVAEATGLPIEGVTWVMRALLVAVPVLAGWLAYRYSRRSVSRRRRQ